MNKGYLETLDGKLAAGAARLGRHFAEPRVRYVLSKQTSEGGFVGRLGDADIYYTDFALRTLVLLGAHDAAARAEPYVARQTDPPRDPTECFNRLNCARLLARCGIRTSFDAAAIRARLALEPGSAYDAFLTALCFEILGETPSGAAQSQSAALSACQDAARNPSQTNSAAAATAFLRMHDALDAEAATSVAAFIASVQAPSGGFLAHPAAPVPDLLSTFTALVTLSDAGALGAVDLASAARFVRSLATPDGAFRSCENDPEADVEYAYYGTAATALLRGYLAGGWRSPTPAVDVC